MLNLKPYVLVLSLSLVGCEDMATTQSAEDALMMCKTAALKLIDGTGTVDFPSSFRNPFRDPTVVRLRYKVNNTEATGTIRCYFDENTDDRVFTRITLDNGDIDVERLPSLTRQAKSALGR